MLLHHFLYAFLDGKTVINDNSFFYPSIRTQSHSEEVGIVLAFISKTFLSSAILVAFAQLFWLQIRARPFTIAQIDAVVKCRDHPLSLPSLPAWTAATWPFMLSCLAMAMAVVGIITPGALEVTVGTFNSARSCTVQSLNINPNSFLSNAGIIALTRVMSAQSYLPPLNPCQPSDCRYDVTFNAPAYSCQDISSSYNFSNLIVNANGNASYLTSPDGWVPEYIWSGSITARDSTYYVLTVATLDTPTNHTQAVNCSLLHGTYSATMTHTNFSSTVEVSSVKLGDPYNYTAQEGDFEFGQYVSVNLVGKVPAFTAANDNSVIKSSAFFKAIGEDFNWTWKDLLTTLPDLMQNQSLSLFSQQITFVQTGQNNKSASPLTDVSATCSFSAQEFTYNRVRLLATYGAALFATAICLAVGYYAIHRNGVEEDITFSRLLSALLNKSLYIDRSEALSDRTFRLQAAPGKTGELWPAKKPFS